MDQQQLFRTFPDMEYDEMATVMKLGQGMTEQQPQQFPAIFQSKRKDQQLMLILTIIGFFGVAGIQRIFIGDIALGVLYFFTAGLCFIGTIVDLVNIKNLTSRYNQKMAYEAANLATASYK